jgi:hypothetical protein
MFHPLISNAAELPVSELESKIGDLTKKYFLALKFGNSDLANQVAVALEMYRTELQARNLASSKIPTQNGNKDLDDLIKIS